MEQTSRGGEGFGQKKGEATGDEEPCSQQACLFCNQGGKSERAKEKYPERKKEAQNAHQPGERLSFTEWTSAAGTNLSKGLMVFPPGVGKGQ